MAHKHLSYLDIPKSRRRVTAGKVISQLKDSLGNPALTDEQRTAVLSKIDQLNQWASGTLPVHHVVEISEDVPVEEGAG